MRDDFWSHRRQDDFINDGIWLHSPAVQHEVQPAADAVSSGVGAQQAMLIPDKVLPWVPDIIGKRWTEPDAVLIVGSAYAPFVTGHGSRSNTMPLDNYVNAASWQEFQTAFINHVVANDSSYYGPLAAFAAATSTPNDCSSLAVFDLCRVSFVERTAAGFKGGDGVVRQHCSLYERYVEHPQNREWLWRRLRETAATRIVALGSIAEHGLMRLSERQRCELRISEQTRTLLKLPNGVWVKKYASPDWTLTTWTQKRQWWEVRGANRRWTVLPVAHPGGWGTRDGYKRECELLSKMG